MQVNGVDLGKVDKVHLARVAAQLGVKAPPGSSTQRLVEEVGKVFAGPKMNLAGPCDNCGGMSDSALTECPFCGIGEEDAEDDKARGKQPVKPVVKASTALVAPLAVASAAMTGERKLDEALKRIEALKGGLSVSMWGIGREIKAIYDAQLWLQRTKDGKPAYKGFDAFAHGELGGFSRTTTYWLMDVAEAFSEAEVLAYGRTKLGMILKAPKEDRTLLLDKVKAGITVRALSEEVDAARGAKGELVRETARGTDLLGRDQTAQREGKVAAAKKRGKKAKGDSITIAKTFGRQQVKLWVRPEKRDAEPTKRARKLADKPYGVLDLENGVRMHFGITTSSAGDMILVVETKRETGS